ncbi:MAG: hypothetical protein ACKVVT_04090 [Dehalococcoidia bacterium]
MEGRFTRSHRIQRESSADGQTIAFVWVSFDGEGPHDRATWPVALGFEPAERPRRLGPTAGQVADRLVRQANLGLAFLTPGAAPASCREFFFNALNATMIPRELSIPEPVQDALEAILAAQDLVRPR